LIASSVIAQWTEALGVGDPRLAALGDLRFTIANLVGDELGYAEGKTIQIDADAAGYGWFVDLSPDSSSEFQIRFDDVSLRAQAGSVAYAHMDLVTVLAHEVGHILGFTHADAAAHPVMGEDLAPGLRYLLDALDFDADPDKPISDRTLHDLARRAVALEANAQAQGGPQFKFQFDLDRSGSGAHGAIDWESGGSDGWDSSYSPFAAGKANKAASSWGNFSDFLFKPFRGSDAAGKTDIGNIDAILASTSEAARKAAKGASWRS